MKRDRHLEAQLCSLCLTNHFVDNYVMTNEEEVIDGDRGPKYGRHRWRWRQDFLPAMGEDWAEHLIRGGPSAFKQYVEECKNLGFDTIELNAGILSLSKETLLRFVRLIQSGGLKAKPQFAMKFNKSDIPVAGDRAYRAYIAPVPRTYEIVEDVTC
uniref:Uncharacterized protein n=1 Tax=Nelumbo nucifera TaxID=4432 RepID=A0A822ZB56_NELNU|nr:TPA_asm: hypothetical protein HUJ06_000582 [Nelumbo nucifera]